MSSGVGDGTQILRDLLNLSRKALSISVGDLIVIRPTRTEAGSIKRLVTVTLFERSTGSCGTSLERSFCICRAWIFGNGPRDRRRMIPANNHRENHGYFQLKLYHVRIFPVRTVRSYNYIGVVRSRANKFQRVYRKINETNIEPGLNIVMNVRTSTVWKVTENGLLGIVLTETTLQNSKTASLR